MYAYILVFLYVCMFARVCAYVCMHFSMYAFHYTCMYVCLCVPVRIYVCILVCMFACMYTCMLLRIHVCFRPDRLAKPRWELICGFIPESIRSMIDEEFLGKSPRQMLAKLCVKVYKLTPRSETKTRFRVALYYIYNRAVQPAGKFQEVREALMSGGFYETALTLDVSDQVLYNRTLTQVGLAAFREQNILGTATALSEICGSSKQRELLAQGVAIVKGFEKTPEQEKAERRRLLPSHLHLNLDVVETAYNL